MEAKYGMLFRRRYKCSHMLQNLVLAKVAPSVNPAATELTSGCPSILSCRRHSGPSSLGRSRLMREVECRRHMNNVFTFHYKRLFLLSYPLNIQRIQQASFISLPGSGTKQKEYKERRILGFSMEQMYDVVSDVERYQEFLPWCQKSLVKARRKSLIIADLIVGFPPLVESYTSNVTLVKPYLIRAESTQGKLFNQLITTWKFSPGLKDKPKSCVVDFYVSFEFKSALTSQLANAFFNEVVIAMVRAFYNEAKNRYGAESIPSRKINIVTTGGSDNNS